MKKILDIININKKYLVAFIYAIISCIVFANRSAIIYSHMPIIQNFAVIGKILDVIFIILVVTGLMVLIKHLHCPLQIKHKFNKVCLHHDIKNAANEFPQLCSVNLYDKHKYFYTIINKDITRTMFMKKAEALEQALDMHIDDIRVCGRGKRTEIFITPKKYYKPTEISLDNEHLGSNMTVDGLVNAVICGNTGSGKTVLMKMLIAKIAKYQPTANFHILDFKNYDFREFADCPLYYSYKDCVIGMNDFYNFFKEQQKSGKPAKEPQYLIIDEWASFVKSLDKKTQEDMIAKLEEIVMISRAYNYHILVGVQRADSCYFGSARFNFKLRFAMGNLDADGKRMLFSGYTELMNEQNVTGEGYLLVDGKGLERIKVSVKDFEKLDEMVGKAMR